jgi:sulfonate transport system substrate-binding protein
MKKLQFNVGGVPEHFNMPWHLAMEEGLFEKANISVNWQEYGGGTGAMAKDLRENSLDIALLLTEGAIADIIKGGNYRIAGLYVSSPLIWGIHVHREAPYQQMKDIRGKTFAISRYGSGSHLMAFVNAKQLGWDYDKLSFEVVGNLEGAREALANGQADAFMWEKYTTKPLVDSGEWRRIGECPTPWPCFVVVVRNEIASEQAKAVQKLLDVVHESCQRLKSKPDAASLIARYYQLREEDAQSWFQNVAWAFDNSIEKALLEEVMDTLHQLKLIDKKVAPEQLCNDLCELR